MRSRPGASLFFALVLLLPLVATAPARADLVGVRAGLYTKVDEPFVGAELLFPLGRRLYLNPNIEYVFIPDRTYMTFNADFHADLPTRGRTYVWFGGGLGIIYVDPEGSAPSDTKAGANLLFGVGLKGDTIPYLQAKLIAKKETEFVVAFGLRF